MENVWMEPVVDKYKKYFGDTANTIIDVGTRDGDDAEFLRERLSAENVYAIDANPLAVIDAKAKYPNFNVFETAISNYDGTTKFVQIVSEDKDHAGSSSIENYSFFKDAEYNTIEVPVTRMDTFIKDNGLSDTIIDVIKVDIEGYTHEFLEGLGEYIKNVKLFHLETETFYRHHQHKTNNHIINFMINSGFLLCDVQYQWGEGIQDQIWINPNYIVSY
jgi:FkbM family methyltransferase